MHKYFVSITFDESNDMARGYIESVEPFRKTPNRTAYKYLIRFSQRLIGIKTDEGTAFRWISKASCYINPITKEVTVVYENKLKTEKPFTSSITTIIEDLKTILGLNELKTYQPLNF